MNMLLRSLSFRITACAACMLIITPVAHATYRFTYNSPPVDWNFAERNGAELINVGSDVTPDFSVVFDVPDIWMQVTDRTEFLMPQATVHTWNEAVPYTVTASSGNVVAMSDGGSIWGWRFNFDFAPVFAADTDPLTIATNKHYSTNSTSSMGSSCPCDNITMTMNDIEYVNGQPTPSGSILINYRAVNAFGPGWNVERISAVPEPSEAMMLLGGLLVIGWLARGKRAMAARFCLM